MLLAIALLALALPNLCLTAQTSPCWRCPQVLSQRAADLAALAQRIEQLEALLRQAGSGGAEAGALLAGLRTELASSLEEARYLASQAHTEAQATKRSSTQVGPCLVGTCLVGLQSDELGRNAWHTPLRAVTQLWALAGLV